MTDRQPVKWRKFRNVQIWNELCGHTYITEVQLWKLNKIGSILLAAFMTRFPHPTDAYCNVYCFMICYCMVRSTESYSGCLGGPSRTASQMQKTPFFTAARSRLAQSPRIWPCTQSFCSIRFQKTSLPSGHDFCTTFFLPSHCFHAVANFTQLMRNVKDLSFDLFSGLDSCETVDRFCGN